MDFKSQMVFLEANPLWLLCGVGVALEKRDRAIPPGSLCLGPALGSLFSTPDVRQPPKAGKPDIYHPIFKFFKPIPKHGFSSNKTLKDVFSVLDFSWRWLPAQVGKECGHWTSCYGAILSFSFLASVRCFCFFPLTLGNQAFDQLHDQSKNGNFTLPLDPIWLDPKAARVSF